MTTKPAIIERLGDSFFFKREESPTVVLLPVPGGFVPTTKPAGFAYLERVSRVPYGLICHYSDGSSYEAVKMTGSIWQVEAPSMGPPPTLATIAPITVLMSNRLVTRALSFTVSGAASWSVTRSSTSIGVSIQGSVLRVRSYSTPGRYTVTVRLTDQWGRSVSRVVQVHVPRRPTLTDLPSISLYPSTTNVREVYSTYEGASPAFSVSANNSIVSVERSGSGGTRRVRVTSGTALGTTEILMRITDQWGQTASRLFNVTVIRRPAGWRWPFSRDDVTPGRLFHGGHNGIDFGYGAAQGGAPIRAAGPGVVRLAGWEPGGHTGAGWCIIIAHDDGMETLYAHMASPPRFNPGTRVDSTSVVGYVGTTGWSTGNHLHFQLQPVGSFSYRDPYPYMVSKGAVGW